MEKTSLPYSTKNIPVPSKNIYLQGVIHRGSKFFSDLRWRCHFFLNPQARPSQKENYDFKSINPAPPIKDLKNFEDKFVNLVRNIKFRRQPNQFQNQLKNDVKKIKQETRAHIKADKSNNFYKMENEDYKKLVEKEIQKEYRKATKNELKNIENKHKDIVTKLDL